MEELPSHNAEETHTLSYTHVTAEECYVISHLKVFQLRKREIGRRLNRRHTTIKQEVARNRPQLSGVYWLEAAHPLALERRARARLQRNYQVAA